MRPIHPGEIIKEEYLLPFGITSNQLAKAMCVTPARVCEIVKGTRNVTANTAIRLSIALNTTPEFWLNLQNTYDLRQEKLKLGKILIGKIKPIVVNGVSEIPNSQTQKAMREARQIAKRLSSKKE